jgi:hypothetical protein
MKNWTACIIASIVCRLLGLVAVLAFVYFMVVLTGSLGCLWLLFLILAVEFIPTYEFKSSRDDNKEKNNGN